MRKFLAGVALVAGLMVAGVANAADYILPVWDTRMMVAVDLDTLQRKGDRVTAWQTVKTSKPAQTDGGAILFLVSRIEFDCAAKESRIVQIAVYPVQGSPVMSTPTNPMFEGVIPETVNDIILGAVCNPDALKRSDKLTGTRNELMDAYDLWLKSQ